jgi:hypothetical protein
MSTGENVNGNEGEVSTDYDDGAGDYDGALSNMITITREDRNHDRYSLAPHPLLLNIIVITFIGNYHSLSPP